jgi:hypothetical protein
VVITGFDLPHAKTQQVLAMTDEVGRFTVEIPDFPLYRARPDSPPMQNGSATK